MSQSTSKSGQIEDPRLQPIIHGSENNVCLLWFDEVSENTRIRSSRVRFVSRDEGIDEWTIGRERQSCVDRTLQVAQKRRAITQKPSRGIFFSRVFLARGSQPARTGHACISPGRSRRTAGALGSQPELARRLYLSDCVNDTQLSPPPPPLSVYPYYRCIHESNENRNYSRHVKSRSRWTYFGADR